MQVTAYAFRSENPLTFAGVTVLHALSRTVECRTILLHAVWPTSQHPKTLLRGWGRGSPVCRPAAPFARDLRDFETTPKPRGPAVMCAAAHDPNSSSGSKPRAPVSSPFWGFLYSGTYAALLEHHWGAITPTGRRTRATRRYPRCSP